MQGGTKMDLGLARKNVIVVGGSSNLGRTCCLAFAKEGSSVIVVARHIQDCQKVGEDSLWSATVKGALSPEDKQNLFKDFESKTPMGRIAKPIDVAHAVLFFASDVMSGHVTGNVIGTDGGIYMTH